MDSPDISIGAMIAAINSLFLNWSQEEKLAFTVLTVATLSFIVLLFFKVLKNKASSADSPNVKTSQVYKEDECQNTDNSIRISSITIDDVFSKNEIARSVLEFLKNPSSDPETQRLLALKRESTSRKKF
ncbi:MAG: hypothetical protein FWG52_03200 [Proteobacteria bacterium]|nr:hypothetical protein [Pseudomonadota bacterium]